MSKLPEHKKSPEELARLREDLGIVHRERQHPVPPPPAGPSLHPNPTTPAASVMPPTAPTQPAAGTAAPQAPRGPKPVRSLKRSERLAPAAPRAHAASSHSSHPLPGHRHTPEELAELRRREAAATLAQGGFDMPREASGRLLGLAYGLSLAGAASPLLMNLLGRVMASHHVAHSLGKGYHLLVAGCAAGLAAAAFIFLRRTQSRHHAAIIAIIAALALVFSLLHYFPALKYGQ